MSCWYQPHAWWLFWASALYMTGSMCWEAARSATGHTFILLKSGVLADVWEACTALSYILPCVCLSCLLAVKHLIISTMNRKCARCMAHSSSFLLPSLVVCELKKSQIFGTLTICIQVPSFRVSSTGLLSMLLKRQCNSCMWVPCGIIL